MRQILIAVYVLLMGFLPVATGQETAQGGNTGAYEYYTIPGGYSMPEIQPWQQCLLEVCGPNLNGLQMGLNQFIVSAPGKTLMQRHWNTFNELNLLFQEGLREDIPVYQAAVRAYDQNILVNDKNALRVAYRMQLALKTINHIKLQPDSKIDLAATEKLMREGEVPEEDIRRAIKLLEKKPKFRNYELLEKDYWFYVNSESPEKVRAQLRAIIKEVDVEQTQILKQLGSGGMNFVDSLAQQRMRNARLLSGKLDPRDVESLSSDLNQARLMGLYFGPGDDHGLPPFRAQERIPREVAEAKRQYLEAAQEALRPNPPATNRAILNFNEVFQKCLNTLAEAEYLLPNRKKVEEFMKNEKAGRAAFASGIGKHFSTESGKNLQAGLNSAMIKPPQSFEEWRQRLNADIKEARKRARTPVQGRTSPGTVQMALAMAPISGISADDEWAESVDEICKDLKVNPLPDGAYSADGQALFGPMTAFGPAEDNFICNHEYGHLAGGHFEKAGHLSEESQGKYKAIRECLAKPHGGIDKYVGEDWADWLAQAGGGQHPHGNPFCLFMDPLNPAAFTLQNENATDPHSSNFFRVLHYRFYNGGIPEVCTQALKAKGEEPKFEKCAAEPGKAAQ